MLMRRIVFLVILLFLFVFLSACQSSDQQLVLDVPSKIVNDKITKKNAVEFFGTKQIYPLKVESLNFNMVSDWLDDENILYVMNSNPGQEIFSFNLFTGKKKLFYSTENPIVKITANTDNSYFLIQTAPSTYEAMLIVVDKKGDEVFKWKVGSNELLVTWNPYIKDQLYITTFLVDWSFQTYIIHAKSQLVLENDSPVPFIQWLDKSMIAYLKWNEDEPTFTAPLYSIDLASKKEKKILEDISYFESFSNTLMTFTTDEKEELAQYSFYDIKTMQKIGDFNAPLLAKYSDWFIPSFTGNQNMIYTFKPYQSGDYDQYKDNYDLISYSVKNDVEKVILSNINQMPLRLSPNGKLCLYGFYYENIINMKDQQIIQLINMG